MNYLQEIIILLILFWVLGYIYDLTLNTESFKSSSQNQVVNNVNDIALKLEYPNTPSPSVNNINPNPMGPSSDVGVNQNNNADVFDERGFRRTRNYQKVTNDDLSNFERTYMLDPSGSLAQYDITNSKVSPNCCPSQYAPPFRLSDDEDNCDYANKYVANNYSGMNFADGYGCTCVTPKQAEFYGNRGGNSN